MAVVVSLSGASATQTLYQATMVAQDIIDATSQDVRSVLGTSGSDQGILLDYVNRVHKEMLRATSWVWLLSAPQRFVTEYNVTDYWIGVAAGNTPGTQDTGLNLTNVRRIDESSFFDLSNNRPLGKVHERTLSDFLTYQDGSSRGGYPRNWRQSPENPYVLNIYPAPDNTNTYQPVPYAPVCETVTSGALTARTYYVKTTFIDSAGSESSPSLEARIFVPANKLLKVKAPQPYVSGSTSGITYSNYKVYVATTSNSETLQSVSTSVAADWTEPGTGLVAGAALPTVNNIEPLRGYVIEFRYHKTRKEITDPQQVLQVPDDYKDVICAGVNWLAYQFLKRPTESRDWFAIYRNGLRDMLKDMNIHPHADFILPG